MKMGPMIMLASIMARGARFVANKTGDADSRLAGGRSPPGAIGLVHRPEDDKFPGFARNLEYMNAPTEVRAKMVEAYRLVSESRPDA